MESEAGKVLNQLVTPAADAVPWWQVAGACVAVFVLLILFLKGLGRIGGVRGGKRAGLIEVLPVGHRREIQVLRFEDEVHCLYCQDGSLVQLRRMSHDEWRASHPEPVAEAGAASFLKRLAPSLRGLAAFGASRSA